MSNDLVSKTTWARVAFGDVVRLVRERSSNPESDGFDRYVGLEHLDPSDLTIRRWGNVLDGTTFTNVFRAGQVLFGKRRAYQRKVALADFDGVCSGDIYVFESKNERLLPELLPFICQTDRFFEHAVWTSAGSLSPRTNWESLAAFEFPLPSLHEQRRIATTLSSIVSVAEALRLLLHRTDLVEYSLLMDAFGSEVGHSQRGIPLVPLAEVAEIRTGLAKGRQPDAGTTTRTYLRVANVKDGELDLREMKEIVVAANQIDRYTLRNGDVLMTEGGDLDKLGRGTVWQGEIVGCLHQNHVFAVRTDPDRLDPWYLAALGRSPYGRHYFLSCAKRTSNLASVNKQQVSNLPVPLPPIHHQRRWVEGYRALRHSRAHAEARIQSVELMHRTVLGQIGLTP